MLLDDWPHVPHCFALGGTRLCCVPRAVQAVAELVAVDLFHNANVFWLNVMA